MLSSSGASVLANVGLDEMIATSVEAYIETAVRWAGESKRAELARLRQELRPRMTASPLTNFAAFTRHLESAYRDMWHGVTGDIPFSAVLDDAGDVFLAKRENGRWKYISRDDVQLPKTYVAPRDRVQR